MLNTFGTCVLLPLMLRCGRAAQLTNRGSRGLVQALDSTLSNESNDMYVDMTNWTGKANEDLFMRYMPERNIIVCGCGKCGSTSMYGYIYSQLHEHSFQDEHGPAGPYVQEVFSERWNKSFQLVLDEKAQESLIESAYSFALVRDPKERIISAWKSKVACNGKKFQTDKYDREDFVPAVLRLADRWGDKSTCLSLEAFVGYLRDIKQKDRSQYLDRHFLPQNLGCFRRYPPEQWSKVTPIDAPGAFIGLAHALGSSNLLAPETHSSDSKIRISESLANLLDEVTADEYAILSPYLSRPSLIKAGAQV